jgi:hypothetical protein
VEVQQQTSRSSSTRSGGGNLARSFKAGKETENRFSSRQRRLTQYSIVANATSCLEALNPGLERPG